MAVNTEPSNSTDADMFVKMRNDVMSNAILPGMETVGGTQKLKQRIHNHETSYLLSSIVKPYLQKAIRTMRNDGINMLSIAGPRFLRRSM